MRHISPDLQDALSDRAREHYSTVLPYHNWEQARDTMSVAARFAVHSDHPEITDNGPLLIISAAWQGADYYMPDNYKFASKEERAAAAALQSLPELWDEDRELLASGIIDTDVAKTAKDTLFGNALYIATQGYFAGSNKHFVKRIRRIREELKEVPWELTVERTKTLGAQVLAESEKPIFEILPNDEAEQWLESIQENLDYLQHKFDSNKLT
ncbi:MAG: hypothetical protein V4611_03565 [Patescibacteria group bacterium]